MAKSMQHWNGDQLVVIDTETSGLDPSWHELLQIAIVPLDSNCQVRQDVQIFYINIKPEAPERADPDAMRVNKLDLADLVLQGHDCEKAKDLLVEWVNTLGLPYTDYGNRKRLIPLGQNYSFDKGFIEQWLGSSLYNSLFHYHYRDTQVAASFLNDHAAMHAEKVPFSKTGLAWLAKTFNIQNSQHHDALNDCRVTAEVYRQLLMRGGLV
jgi:DNA polymerase III epsilon subunit-like protein